MLDRFAHHVELAVEALNFITARAGLASQSTRAKEVQILPIRHGKRGYRSRDDSKLLIMDCFVPAYYSDVDYVKPCGQWGERVLPDAPEPGNALASLDKLGISHVLHVKWSASTVDRNLEGIPGSSPTAVFDALKFRVPPNFPGLLLVFERPDQRVYRVNRPE